MKKKSEGPKYSKNVVIWYHTILMLLMATLFLVYFVIQVHEIGTYCDLRTCPEGPAIQIMLQARTEAIISFGFGMGFLIAALTYNHTKRFIG